MRKILITGASSGIGLQIAHKELKEGNRVSIGIRNLESIKGTIIDPQNWKEGQIIVNKYDALDESTAKNWIENTNNKFGSFDTLINCAGILSRIPFLYKEEDKNNIIKIMSINFFSVWELCKLSWKNLASSNNGRIITLVSMSGKRSKGDLAAYSSSKFALMGLCQTMRNKGWDENIRVTAICPSWVNTKMASEINAIKKNEMTQPEDIADICSMILKLPKQAVPFEILVNCNLEI
tara:strand:+ start:22301 stop:23008 length:708 start_codon:yes stop_codon:yes gene_type:complete